MLLDISRVHQVREKVGYWKNLDMAKKLSLQDISSACLEPENDKFSDGDPEGLNSDEDVEQPCFRDSNLITEVKPVRF